jgi:hypothetical protein
MVYNTPSIKDVIKEIFEGISDGVAFVPDKKHKGLHLSGFSMKNGGTYETCDAGDMFHILLYRCDEHQNVYDVEKFEAVLTGPAIYIDNLIKCGFYGVVVKKTIKTHSTEFINSLYENLI